jgi:hypothetical protein
LQFNGERRRGRGEGFWKFDRCDVEIADTEGGKEAEGV